MNDPLHPHHFAHAPLPHVEHLFNSPHPPPTLVSQHELDDPLDFNPFGGQLDNPHDLSNPFDPSPPHYDPRAPQPRLHEIRSNVPINGFQHPQSHGQSHGENNEFQMPQRIVNTRQLQEHRQNRAQFGVLTPHPPHPHLQQNQFTPQHDSLGSVDLRAKQGKEGGTSDGHFSNMKVVPHPPHLEEWRQKLFDVDEKITLTEDQYVS